MLALKGIVPQLFLSLQCHMFENTKENPIKSDQMRTTQDIKANPSPTNKTFQSRLWGEVSSGGSICRQHRIMIELKF